MKALVDLVAARHGPEAAVGVGLALLNVEAAFPDCIAGVAALIADVESYRDMTRPPAGPSPLELPSSAYRAAVRGRKLGMPQQLALLRSYLDGRHDLPGVSLSGWAGMVLDPPAPPDPEPEPDPGPPAEVPMGIELPPAAFDAAWARAAAMAGRGEYRAVDDDGCWDIPAARGRRVAVGVAAAEGGPYLDVALVDDAGGVVAEGEPLYGLPARCRLVDGAAAYVVDIVAAD